MEINQNVKVKLMPLTIRKDRKNYITENKVTNEYFEMPKICVDAVNLMGQGYTNSQIAQLLELQYPDESINMKEFTQQLIELNLVDSIDDKKIFKYDIKKNPSGFQGIPVKLGHVFFNKCTLLLYSFLFIINISVFIFDSKLLPHYKDLFLFDSIIVNVIVFGLLSLVILIHHEFGHILATRAYDLSTKLEIGHRMFFIVLQTDLTPTWKLQPRQRLVPYLGGLCFDNIILFIALITSLVFPNNFIITGIMGMVIFDIFIKFVYQCSVFMKTDLYYVIENITSCYNLMDNGKKWIFEKTPFFSNNKKAVVYDTEIKIVKLYAIFYLMGILLSLSLFVFYFIPQFLFVFNSTVPHLFDSITSIAFWDAIVFLITIIMMGSLLLYSWTKKYILKKE